MAHLVLVGYKPEHRNLKNWERLGAKVCGVNYVWYQIVFEVKADDLVKQHGFTLLKGIKELFAKAVGEMSPPKRVEKMEVEYQGFQEWATIFKRQENEAH